MKRGTLAVSAVLALFSVTPAGHGLAAGSSAPAIECPAPRGVLAIDDIARGRCLFHSATVLGQDPRGPFPSCAVCHHRRDKSQRGVPPVQITNSAGPPEAG